MVIIKAKSGLPIYTSILSIPALYVLAAGQVMIDQCLEKSTRPVLFPDRHDEHCGDDTSLLLVRPDGRQSLRPCRLCQCLMSIHLAGK